MMGIELKAEFTMKTFAGFFTYCNASKNIYSNYRDIDNVEDAIKYVKGIFTHGARDVMVTFIFDNGSLYGCSTARLYAEICGGFTELAWDKRGNLIKQVKHEKLTKNLIKQMYLDCAEQAIEYEERKEVAE